MAACRPAAHFTVYSHARAGPDHPQVTSRPLPSGPLVGRHLRWPRELRRLHAGCYFGAAGVLPLGRLSLPAVVTAHDMAIYRHPEWFPGGQILSVRFVVPRSMRRADAIVAVSRHTAGEVAALFGVAADRLHVVPEGVAPSYRPLTGEELAITRARYELPDRFILFVGTIEPRKNLLTLVDAWSRLADRPPLVVAGDWGWRFEEVRPGLEKASSGVRLLGAVDPGDLPALYNLASCLAHPAWYEGFGLTPLEAMACGTPVAVSSATSLPEVVGDAGLLVDPADVEGWTSVLERLLADAGLRADLRHRGLQRAAAFSWERAATATWEIVDLAAGSTARPAAGGSQQRPPRPSGPS